VDFWLALIFDTLGFPPDMFPVWCFIPRVSGLIAHLVESLDDPEYKIFRPRQVYIGHDLRPYQDFTVPSGNPNLDSKTPIIYRPRSLHFNQLESKQSILDELGDIDFPIQEKPTKITSWLAKKFVPDSHKKEHDEEIRMLRDEVKRLNLRIVQLEKQSYVEHVDHFSPKGTKFPEIESPSRTADIDIMKGSKNARVIKKDDE
jgi:citrate synthase